MLKPNAVKTALADETAELVAAFKQRGGVISKVEPNVSAHLRKTRYIGRSAMRGVSRRLGDS